METLMKPMSKSEYAKALDGLGFTNRGFCKWLGVDERTGRKWIDGTSPIQPGVAAFLRLALELELDAEELREKLGD
jgi:hypothetical protein